MASPRGFTSAAPSSSGTKGELLSRAVPLRPPARSAARFHSFCFARFLHPWLSTCSAAARRSITRGVNTREASDHEVCLVPSAALPHTPCLFTTRDNRIVLSENRPAYVCKFHAETDYVLQVEKLSEARFQIVITMTRIYLIILMFSKCAR